MIPLDLAGIAGVVGGVVHDDDGSTVVDGPATVDSRAVEAGGLFVAVVGEHLDGHAYAAAAVAQGAAALLGSRSTGVPTVVVDDAVVALGKLAAYVRRQLPAVSVVALTGSQGKTGTKDLLAHVLAGTGRTVATAGNLNNEIGVPLTVLRADASTEHLVVEMGARGLGHVAALCEIARPDISVVLNVGKSHLGEFGTQADIARAKGEIVEGLEGTAVLNADDPLVAAMAARTQARVLTFGFAEGADLRIDRLSLDELGRPRFRLSNGGEHAAVALGAVGAHQASNAAAAAAAAIASGARLAVVASALSAARQASRWRMELHELGNDVVVVNDAYNANPDSMAAALAALAGIGGRRPGARTIAVLGEMLELGAASTAEHEAVGRLAAQLDVDRVIVVGDGAQGIATGAGRDRARSVRTGAEALSWLVDNGAAGDVVLVKASRGARLETVAEALVAGAMTMADGVASDTAERERNR